MPNKYSHSVVLAHYSSLGLIDLPNDQYITYLKTYPTSRRTSTTPGSKPGWGGTHSSRTPSSGYSTRHRHLDEHAPGSRSVTSRSEYGSNSRRDIIVESDEESADEGVVLHRKYEPIEQDQKSQKRAESQEPKVQKRNSPSAGSTYTGRSSSEKSESSPSRPVPERASPVKDELKRNPPSVINLNQFDAAPPKSEPNASGSSGPRPEHISAQVRPANAKMPPSSTSQTRVYSLNPHEDLNFAGFSDRHLSDVTITASSKTLNASPAPTVPRSQFSKTPSYEQGFSSSSAAKASLPKRVDSASGFDRNVSKQTPLQPSRNGSFDSISSMNSEDMMHLTTALPPVIPTNSQKPLYPEPAKICPPSRDPEVNEDAIDPKFFETLRGGPGVSSASPTRSRYEALDTSPPASPKRPSLHSSRQSSADSIDPTPPNPDFWRGLEEMLSDSDSAVFPPDIAKHKPRDNHALATTKVNKSFRNGTADREPKRPMTAPAQGVSSREISCKENPLPRARSKVTFTTKGSPNKPGDAREMPTGRLVDTSAQKQAKKGFLRKLKKRNHSGKKP